MTVSVFIDKHQCIVYIDRCQSIVGTVPGWQTPGVLGRPMGLSSKEMPDVLFVCVHNAGRSQMAAGLLRLRSQDRIGVRSAGSAPADEVNPLVVEAMAEIGVDLADAFPKPLTDDAVRAADVVVTMGCGDACPIFPGKRYEDWVLDDPAEAESLDEVRAIRDEIDARIRPLVDELLRGSG